MIIRVWFFYPSRTSNHCAMTSKTQRDTDTREIDTHRFKRLIFELRENCPNNRIRVRTLGNMWDRNFSEVIHITAGDGIILQNNEQMKHVSLNDVISFELEMKFQDFEPNNHWKVVFP
jgi:hypothetical protein